MDRPTSQSRRENTNTREKRLEYVCLYAYITFNRPRSGIREASKAFQWGSLPRWPAMNGANTKRLLRRFPFLYRHYWGFDVGDGWFNLIWDLSLAIEKELNLSPYQIKKQMFVEWLERRWRDILAIFNINPSKWAWHSPRMFYATQIKEKLGTLSYYASNTNSKVVDLTIKALDISGTICEECGRPGKIIDADWIYTACPEHTKEEDLDQWNDEMWRGRPL